MTDSQLSAKQLTTETQNEKKEESQRRIEFNFPLLIIRTKIFSGIFDKLGSYKAAHYASWITLFLVPFIAGIALYLIVNSLIGLLSNPAVGQVVRDLGPGSILLLPGINPILPIVYGWVAIALAIVIHEGAQGVVARNVGLSVKSSGLLFFLIIPIGAFVDVDEEQIKKARPRSSLRVMAAGVGGNIVVAAVCLILMLVLVGGLTPITDGVYFNDVTAGLPAQEAGILPRDVLVSIDDIKINNISELRTALDNKTAGDIVKVTVERGEKWQNQFTSYVNLTVTDNRTVMGVLTSDLMTEARLKNYQTFSIERLTIFLVPPTLASGIVPFSDALAPFYTHWLGSQWAVLANGLYWLWFVSFNLAIFNALPIYPLDGGRIFKITLQRFAGSKLKDKTIHIITLLATAICVILVASVAILPFIF